MFSNIHTDITPDLVDQVFGKVATTRLASSILLKFLHSNLLTVELDGRELPRDEWAEACALAASLPDSRTDSTNGDLLFDLSKKNYTWKWSQILNENSARGTETFLNVVGLSAYIAAITTGSALELSNRRVNTRFVTLPSSFGQLPDPTSSGISYSPPHFFALPSSSFECENTRNSSCRRDEFLEQPSPMCIIEESFPSILSRFPGILSNTKRQEGPLQTEFFTASDPDTDYDAPLDSVLPKRDELIALGANLEANIQCTALPQLEQLLREQSQRRFLDLSRVCAPEVLLSGVLCVDNFREDMQTVMRHQRRSQPWLRFLLGLAIDEGKIGLFRADAVGLQECIFDRTTGYGIIQCIRIALGIIVATNQEIGIHPAFSFREVVSTSHLESDDERGRSDSVSDDYAEFSLNTKAR
ncbi:hypothetical protein C0992_013362, partial [Termitomyces sp. T32_za158]